MNSREEVDEHNDLYVLGSALYERPTVSTPIHQDWITCNPQQEVLEAIEHSEI